VGDQHCHLRLNGAHVGTQTAAEAARVSASVCGRGLEAVGIARPIHEPRNCGGARQNGQLVMPG